MTTEETILKETTVVIQGDRTTSLKKDFVLIPLSIEDLVHHRDIYKNSALMQNTNLETQQFFVEAFDLLDDAYQQWFKLRRKNDKKVPLDPYKTEGQTDSPDP